TADWNGGQVVVHRLPNGPGKAVLDGGNDGRVFPTGHLVSILRGALFAVAFNSDRLEKFGGPVRSVEGFPKTGAGATQFSFSDNGSLVYIPGPAGNAGGLDSMVLALVERDSVVKRLNIPPGTYQTPRISRDGKRVAYGTDGGEGADIWVYELS